MTELQKCPYCSNDPQIVILRNKKFNVVGCMNEKCSNYNKPFDEKEWNSQIVGEGIKRLNRLRNRSKE